MFRAPRSPDRLRVSIAAGLTLGLAVTLGACGSDGGEGDDTTGDDTATDDGSDAVIVDDELDGYLASAESYDDQTTASGGRLVVTVDCDPQTGGNLFTAAGSGLPEGIYEPEIDPSIGVTFVMQVGPEGSGLGISQTTLDEPTYTVTFSDLDGGVELTVDGCN